MFGKYLKQKFCLKKYKDDESGVAAIEFAMVATPFFALLFGIFEVGLVFFNMSVLNNATASASREIRTGEFQSTGGQAAEFKQLVCEDLSAFMSCDNLKVDVRKYNNFSAVADPAPVVDADGNTDYDDTGYQASVGGEIVVVSVYYEYSLVAPGSLTGLSNISNNKRLLTSITAFRNEPF